MAEYFCPRCQMPTVDVSDYPDVEILCPFCGWKIVQSIIDYSEVIEELASPVHAEEPNI